MKFYLKVERLVARGAGRAVGSSRSGLLEAEPSAFEAPGGVRVERRRFFGADQTQQPGLLLEVGRSGATSLHATRGAAVALEVGNCSAQGSSGAKGEAGRFRFLQLGTIIAYLE